MTKIHTDPLVLAILKRHGRSLEDVPAVDELVLLRESAKKCGIPCFRVFVADTIRSSEELS